MKKFRYYAIKEVPFTEVDWFSHKDWKKYTYEEIKDNFDMDEYFPGCFERALDLIDRYCICKSNQTVQYIADNKIEGEEAHKKLKAQLIEFGYKFSTDEELYDLYFTVGRTNKDKITFAIGDDPADTQVLFEEDDFAITYYIDSVDMPYIYSKVKAYEKELEEMKDYSQEQLDMLRNLRKDFIM